MTPRSFRVRRVISFDVILLKWFVLKLFHRIFEDKLKLKEHHRLKLGFGSTNTYMINVYENFIKSSKI